MSIIYRLGALEFQYDLAVRNHISHITSNYLSIVAYLYRFLLLKGNAVSFHFDSQGIFVNLFEKPIAQCFPYLDGRGHNSIAFFPIKNLVFHVVNLSFSATKFTKNTKKNLVFRFVIFRVFRGPTFVGLSNCLPLPPLVTLNMRLCQPFTPRAVTLMAQPTTDNTTDNSRRFTVSGLTFLIKRLMETHIGMVEVEGEISNWSVSSRGHGYFALKDDGALLSCVMFQSALARLQFTPCEGCRVVATGQVSVYPARGQYQLIVTALRETGVGDLYRRFMELKDKLEKEGLFDPAHKRPLPSLPHRIAVVTSPTGAALRDIIHVIRRRFPSVEILIVPTMVQGDAAPPQIVQAIERVNRLSRTGLSGVAPSPVDVLIVARGGGSIEDLWAFNDERVARAIYNSEIPVISAVGHEVDFTIADFVADVRAPTPSAAAEIVVAEISALTKNVTALHERMLRAITHLVERRRLELRRLAGSWGLRQPLDLVRQAIQRLDDLATRSEAALERIHSDSSHRLQNAAGRLDALNPTAVLARGYSIVMRERDGRIVTRENQAKIGNNLRIQLSEGKLRAVVLPPGDELFEGVDVSS